MTRKEDEHDLKEYSGLIEEILTKNTMSDEYKEVLIRFNNCLYFIYEAEHFPKLYNSTLLIYARNILVELKKNTEPFNEICIMLCYVLYDLENLYPDGNFNCDYKSDDDELEGFWKDNFGDELIICVSKFTTKLTDRFCELDDLIEQLIKDISFSVFVWYDGYVNKSRFSLFVKYYGGFKYFAQEWIDTVADMGFKRMKHYDSVYNDLLERITLLEPGSYVYNLNWRCKEKNWQSKEGDWNLFWIKEDRLVGSEICNYRQLRIKVERGKLIYPNGAKVEKRQCAMLETLKREQEFAEQKNCQRTLDIRDIGIQNPTDDPEESTLRDSIKPVVQMGTIDTDDEPQNFLEGFPSVPTD